MNNSYPTITNEKDIKCKLKEFEYLIKKIERTRCIVLSIFLSVLAFDLSFAITFMYSNPIYPPICLFIFLANPICTFIFILSSKKKEVKLLEEIKEYDKKMEQFYNKKRS